MNELLGKICGECLRLLTKDNRGNHSPYFCRVCDEERVRRIRGRLASLGVELAKKGGKIE